MDIYSDRIVCVIFTVVAALLAWGITVIAGDTLRRHVRHGRRQTSPMSTFGCFTFVFFALNYLLIPLALSVNIQAVERHSGKFQLTALALWFIGGIYDAIKNSFNDRN